MVSIVHPMFFFSMHDEKKKFNTARDSRSHPPVINGCRSVITVHATSVIRSMYVSFCDALHFFCEEARGV